MKLMTNIRFFSALLAAAMLLTGCSYLKDVSAPANNGCERTSESEFLPNTVDAVTSAEAETPADPYADVSVTFTAAGDNLIHPNIYYEAASRAAAGVEYDFKPMFSDVADIISSPDFAFINQETLMAGNGFEVSGYPSFNSPQELGRDLVSLGFDIVNIANNHMLDRSAAGLSATMDFWHSQPVTLLGAYYDHTDAAKLRTVTADGITIAVISYTYGTNGIVLPEGSELDIPYIDDARIISELSQAEIEADFTIVSVHWGDENSSEPNDEQRRLAQLIADCGTDIILGHHSHTLQPLEWIERADGGKTLCAYSLGNLVSAMMYPENMVGGFLNFTVSGDGKGGLCVTDIGFIPTVFYYGTDYYGTHIYLLEDYTDAIATGHGTQLYGYTTTPEKAQNYVRRAIPAEYLPEYLKNAE